MASTEGSRPEAPIAFGVNEVEALNRRYGARAPEARPALWRHATLPEHEPLRVWVNEELRLMDATRAQDFVPRLHAESHQDVLAELAAAYVVRMAGFTVEYEPYLEGLTPDLLATSPDGKQFIAEVWRHALPAPLAKQHAQWLSFAERLHAIRQPARIALMATPDEGHAPTEDTSRRIMQGLRLWLGPEGTPAFPTLTVGDYTFRLEGASSSGHVELVPVWSGVAVDRRTVVNAIDKKVARYRSLVAALEIPFLVIMSADPISGLDDAFVGQVLGGDNTLRFTLPLHAGATSRQVQLRRTNAPPGFDTSLSAVAWLDVNDGRRAKLGHPWPNPRAARVLPGVELFR